MTTSQEHCRVSPVRRVSQEKANRTVGAFIRQKRIEQGLSGAELGRLLNISQQQVSRYECGVTSVSFYQLECILQALSASWGSFTREVVEPLYPSSVDASVEGIDIVPEKGRADFYWG